MTTPTDQTSKTLPGEQCGHDAIRLPLEITDIALYECAVVEQPDPEDGAGGRGIIFQGNRSTAEFIVRACNSHAALLENLEYVLKYPLSLAKGNTGFASEVRANIAKAKDQP